MSSSSSRRPSSRGDVVILDNLGSHKGKEVRKAIRNVGARLVFLPINSPDLNPIEQVFAKFKTLLRKAEARSYEAISDACGKILAQYPARRMRPIHQQRRIRVNLKAGCSKAQFAQTSSPYARALNHH